MSFNKLLRQSLIGRGFYFATSLLLNIVLSRFLLAEGTGFVYYLANFFSLILLISSLSIESGLTFFASNNIIKAKKLAGFGIIFILIILLCLLFFFQFWYDHFENSLSINKFSYTKYALFFIAGILLSNFYTALFQAEQNFLFPNFLMGFLNIFFVIILCFTKWENVSILQITDTFFIFILINGIVIAITYLVIHKVFISFNFITFNELKILFQYSLLALFTNIIFFLVYRIDYWFVKYNCSAGDLGNYIQASKVGQLVLVIPQVIASAIFPKTATDSDLQNNISDAIIKIFRLFTQIFIVLILSVFLFGNWFFIFVFGQSFDKMQSPLLLLLPGIFCLSILSLLSAYFAGKGNLKINMMGALFGLIVVVIGNIFLLKFYSIKIAAIVSTVGYLVNFVYSFYQFFKIINLKFEELFKWKIRDWHWLKNVLLNK